MRSRTKLGHGLLSQGFTIAQILGFTTGAALTWLLRESKPFLQGPHAFLTFQRVGPGCQSHGLRSGPARPRRWDRHGTTPWLR